MSQRVNYYNTGRTRIVLRRHKIMLFNANGAVCVQGKSRCCRWVRQERCKCDGCGETNEHLNRVFLTITVVLSLSSQSLYAQFLRIDPGWRYHRIVNSVPFKRTEPVYSIQIIESLRSEQAYYDIELEYKLTVSAKLIVVQAHLESTKVRRCKF